MKPRRGVEASVFADSESAGSMASSNGSAIVAPMPRMKARRSSAFFITKFISPSLAHLERNALHHAQDQRPERVVIAARALSDDRADRGPIEVLHVAAQAVHQQLLGD